MEPRLTIEQQLFEWEECEAEEGESMSMWFYDIILKVPVGDFPIGTHFPMALVECSSSLLLLFGSEEDEHYGFELRLSVGGSVAPRSVGEGELDLPKPPTNKHSLN